jgi:hypothetical protein
LVDVIQTPTAAPPEAAPATKPSVPHTLSAEKESTAARQERRQANLAKATIPAKDIRKLARKRPDDDGPVAIDFSTMPAKTEACRFAKPRKLMRSYIVLSAA